MRDVKQKENKGNPHRWRKGETGNPHGRPKLGNSVAEAMRVYMAGKEEKKTRTQNLVEHLYRSAIGDNPVPAARLILETLGLLNIEGMLEDIKATLARVEAAEK